MEVASPDLPPDQDAAAIRAELIPAQDGVPPDIDLVGDARLVVNGEVSHGTHEFYAARARMTRRLIEEKGFCAVAAEADWQEAYRVNRYVRGHDGRDADVEEALRDFERFPTWMWRNSVVLEFVGWLREHNDQLARDRPTQDRLAQDRQARSMVPAVDGTAGARRSSSGRTTP